MNIEAAHFFIALMSVVSVVGLGVMWGILADRATWLARNSGKELDKNWRKLPLVLTICYIMLFTLAVSSIKNSIAETRASMVVGSTWGRSDNPFATDTATILRKDGIYLEYRQNSNGETYTSTSNQFNKRFKALLSK